jgi:hypothetical protein
LLKKLHVIDWPILFDGELITEMIKKLPLLEQVVLTGGKFHLQLLLALLDHCPRLELLHARHSWPGFRICDEDISTRIQSRSNIIDFRPPSVMLF